MWAAAIAYLESKTPTWIKVCVALLVIGWMTPLKVREWSFDLIDTRVHAVLAPIQVARDNEIKELNLKIVNLNEKTNETNTFVKEIAIHQLGVKRFEEVKSLAMDNNK